MNKVTFEKIERNVELQSISRTVETKLFRVMSEWSFLSPIQIVDIPKERDGT